MPRSRTTAAFSANWSSSSPRRPKSLSSIAPPTLNRSVIRLPRSALPSICCRVSPASLPPTNREARNRSGNSARHSRVTCQLSASMVMPTTTTAIELATVLDSVLVNARWAPMTSLLSRDTSAPVWVRVKNASDWRCTCPKTRLRRSKISPSPMREDSQPPRTVSTALNRAKAAIASASLRHQAVVALEDAVVHDPLHEQRHHDDHRGVDDGEREEDRDQPPVRPREADHAADGAAVEAVADDRAVGAQVAERRPRAGPVHAHRRPSSSCAQPMTRGELPEPPGLGLSLEATLLVQVGGRRALQQPLGLGHRSRERGGESGDEVGDRGVQLVGRDGGERQADVHGLRGADHPCRGADLECSGVPNRLDQRLCSRQVRHEAERGLLHAELRVVGEHPEVAAQGQLEARADRVALDRGDADEPRVAQPGEALLVHVDRRADGRVVELEQPGDVARARVEHRPVEARGEAVPVAAQDHDPHVVRQLRPICCRPAQVAGVWALRASGRSRVTVATAPSTAYCSPASARLSGVMAVSVRRGSPRSAAVSRRRACRSATSRSRGRCRRRTSGRGLCQRERGGAEADPRRGAEADRGTRARTRSSSGWTFGRGLRALERLVVAVGQVHVRRLQARVDDHQRVEDALVRDPELGVVGDEGRRVLLQLARTSP